MSEPLRIPPLDEMSFEAAEWNQLRDGMRMTFVQKLKWLEETEQLALALKRAGERAGFKNMNRPKS